MSNLVKHFFQCEERKRIVLLRKQIKILKSLGDYQNKITFLEHILEGEIAALHYAVKYVWNL